MASKPPIWKGDVLHCPYCRDAVFPHGHDNSEPGSAPRPRRKPRSAPATPKTPKTPQGRRGRPYKPENADLLAVCPGHGG